MDHLSSSEERKARWYSKVKPRCIPVIPANGPQDLLTDTKNDCFSVPFAWFEKSGMNPSSLSDALRQCLQKDGFVVVSSVLTKEECETVLDHAWDWIEAASVAEKELRVDPSIRAEPLIQRHDLSSLHSGLFPTSLEGGIMPFHGSGHSVAAWKVRSHPGIRAIFNALFETDDYLISSLDGVVFWHSAQVTDAGWFHVDQNPRKKPERCSYQGLLNLLPVTEITGGNVLVRGSHKLFPEHYLNNTDPNCRDFYNTRLDELNGDDWMEIDPNDTKAISPEEAISLMMKPGDFLLWDSRTVHCSHPPSSTSYTSPQLVRAATLVTMMPTRMATPSVLNKRREAVHEQRTLTHWANQVAPLGAECQEQVELETKRVKIIREFQTAANKVILCDWNDLNEYQQSLVVGRNEMESMHSPTINQ